MTRKMPDPMPTDLPCAKPLRSQGVGLAQAHPRCVRGRPGRAAMMRRAVAADRARIHDFYLRAFPAEERDLVATLACELRDERLW